MAKVTMQDIADALGISRVTVWKIFHDQEGVSDTLRVQVINKAAELGYTKYIPGQSVLPSPDRTTVSVIVSRPESSFFWMNIIHRIAQELAGRNTDLIYTYVPSVWSEDYELPSSLSDGKIRGCIILNVYDSKLIRMVNALPLPKVFLDMVPDMPLADVSGDLFLLEGRESICGITEHVIRKGKRRLGFIGDISYALTNADRYQGFLSAMKQNELVVDGKNCLTGGLGIYSYQEEVYRFLDGLEVFPEAFICANDYVASFVLAYMTEHGIKVPEDLYVTGYDGSREYAYTGEILTTVEIKTALIGKRLAVQLMFRMDNPEMGKEVIYVSSPVIYRESTGDL